jgi:hypothetical protein
MKTKYKVSSVLVVALAILLAGCSANQTQEEDTDTQGGSQREVVVGVDDFEDTQTELSDSEDTDEEEVSSKRFEGIEYVWYEDDHVRFEYPKGWEVGVETGKIKPKDLYEIAPNIYKILVKNSKDGSYLEIYDPGGLGWPTWDLDLNTDKIIGSESPHEVVYELNSKPEIISNRVKGHDLSFIGFVPGSIKPKSKSESSHEYVLGQNEDNWEVFMSASSKSAKMKINTLFPIQDFESMLFNLDNTKKDSGVVAFNCPKVNDMDDLTMCSDFITRARSRMNPKRCMK